MPATNFLGGLQGTTGDIQSPLGHVEIDSDPYLLVPGHYLSYPITPFAPKQSEGDPSYQNYGDADSPIGQSTWVGGMGRFRDIDTNVLDHYFEGGNVDPAMRHRMTVAPLQVSEASSVATSATKIMEFNGAIIAACGTQIVQRSDTNGTWSTQVTFANTITDIIIFNANLFVGFGDVADAQYSNGSDLTTWTTLTGRKAKVWAADKDVLYRFFAKNQVDSSSDGITGWGTTVLTGVGDTSADFTSAVSGGVLAFWYAVKVDGVYDLPYAVNAGQTLGASATARRVLPFPYRFSSNGLALAWHGTKLYIGNGHSLWEFQSNSFSGGDAQDISPWRDADLVGTVKGEFNAVFPTPRFLYGVIVDTTNGNASYILRRDWHTGKWHTWVTPSGLCQSIYYRPKETASAVQVSAPTVWFPSGTNMVHCVMPTYGEDPLSDPANCKFNTSYSYDAKQGQTDPTKNISVPDNSFTNPSVYCILPFRDLNLADEDKVENSVRIAADRLNGGMCNVAVDYNEDESRDANGNLIWTFLGRASTSPVSELFYKTGSNKVVGKRNMLRIRPYTAVNTTTPVIRAVVAHKRVLVQVRWAWDITVIVSVRQTGRNEGLTWTDAFKQFRKLQRLHETGTPIVYKDRDGLTFTTLVASVSLTEVQEPNTTPQWALQLRLIQSQFGLAAGVNNAVDAPVYGAGNAATVDEESYVS